jgi:hypothetical protein
VVLFVKMERDFSEVEPTHHAQTGNSNREYHHSTPAQLDHMYVPKSIGIDPV